MAEETTNQGYIDAQNYANDPAGVDAPDSTYQDYERGLNSYGLAQVGEAGVIATVLDADTVNGHIGVNWPTPSFELEVRPGTGDDAGISIAANTNGTSSLNLGDTAELTLHRIEVNHSDNSHRIVVNGAEASRYVDTGALAIGKTALGSNLAGVEISQDGEIVITRSGSTPLTLNRTSTPSDGAIINFLRENTVVGSVSVSAGATAYNTSSDYRLKENVVDLTDATTRLKAIPVKRFNFIADPAKTVDGFLAHEVAAVVPECVTGEKDAMADQEVLVSPAEFDADGNVTVPAVYETKNLPVYQQIDQSKLVPLLVATVQELEARIAALESA